MRKKLFAKFHLTTGIFFSISNEMVNPFHPVLYDDDDVYRAGKRVFRDHKTCKLSLNHFYSLNLALSVTTSGLEWLEHRFLWRSHIWSSGFDIRPDQCTNNLKICLILSRVWVFVVGTIIVSDFLITTASVTFGLEQRSDVV